jgi:hypothetical protein
MKAALLLTAMLALAAPAAPAAEPDSVDSLLGDSKEVAVVSGTSVSAPLGHLLLIQSPDQLCAVQFEAVVRGRDRPAPAAGRESLRVDYQWWLVRGLPDGKLESLRGGQRTVASRSPGTATRPARTFGTPYVECGSVKVAWTFPNRLPSSPSSPETA